MEEGDTVILGFADLCDDVIWVVYSFLPPKDLFRQGLVCRSLRRMSISDQLWNPFVTPDMLRLNALSPSIVPIGDGVFDMDESAPLLTSPQFSQEEDLRLIWFRFALAPISLMRYTRFPHWFSSRRSSRRRTYKCLHIVFYIILPVLIAITIILYLILLSLFLFFRSSFTSTLASLLWATELSLGVIILIFASAQLLFSFLVDDCFVHFYLRRRLHEALQRLSMFEPDVRERLRERVELSDQNEGHWNGWIGHFQGLGCGSIAIGVSLILAINGVVWSHGFPSDPIMIGSLIALVVGLLLTVVIVFVWEFSCWQCFRSRFRRRSSKLLLILQTSLPVWLLGIFLVSIFWYSNSKTAHFALGGSLAGIAALTLLVWITFLQIQFVRPPESSSSARFFCFDAPYAIHGFLTIGFWCRLLWGVLLVLLPTLIGLGLLLFHVESYGVVALVNLGTPVFGLVTLAVVVCVDRVKERGTS